MKKFILVMVLGIVTVAIFNSCYYDKEDFLYPQRTNQQGNCDTTNVTYSGTVKPIFDNNCKGCHGSGTPYNYDGYAQLSSYFAANSQKFLDNINYAGAQPMPPSGKLNDCYLKQIRIWIQAGYPNN
jgi:hypothetical protein